MNKSSQSVEQGLVESKAVEFSRGAGTKKGKR